MYFNYHNLQYLILFLGCVYYFCIGLRAIKIKKSRQAGVLAVFIASVGVFLSVLEIATFPLKVTGFWRQVIFEVKFIFGGIALGIWLIMSFFGHFKLLKKSSSRSADVKGSVPSSDPK